MCVLLSVIIYAEMRFPCSIDNSFESSSQYTYVHVCPIAITVFTDYHVECSTVELFRYFIVGFGWYYSETIYYVIEAWLEHAWICFKQYFEWYPYILEDNIDNIYKIEKINYSIDQSRNFEKKPRPVKVENLQIRSTVNKLYLWKYLV